MGASKVSSSETDFDLLLALPSTVEVRFCCGQFGSGCFCGGPVFPAGNLAVSRAVAVTSHLAAISTQ